MGKRPVSVTLPRLRERALFRTLIPTVAVQNVLEPVAIDISEADAVTVHERCAGLNHPRLENGLTLFSFCKAISHDGVGGAVGVHDVFRNPIAIEVAEISPLILRETGVDQHTRRPQGPRLQSFGAGVLIPHDLRVTECAADDIRKPIAVHVVGVLATIGQVVLAEYLELPERALRLEIRSRIPELARTDVEFTIAIEVRDGAALVIIDVQWLHAKLEGGRRRLFGIFLRALRRVGRERKGGKREREQQGDADDTREDGEGHDYRGNGEATDRRKQPFVGQSQPASRRKTKREVWRARPKSHAQSSAMLDSPRAL